jgi:AcrR family transcriptional regulator
MLKKVPDPESLFEVNKAERRARILQAARKVIARRGVEALTLRDLAAQARVSVPTVYNLIGGKQELLAALMGQTYARVAARLMEQQGGGMVERALALCEAGWSEMLGEPAYFRELLYAFLCLPETAPVRRETDARHVEAMTAVLREGQAQGELARWADPAAVAGALYSHYVVTMLRWAAGDLDDGSLVPTATYGLSLVLLGAARGATARKLERLAKDSQAKSLNRKGAPS